MPAALTRVTASPAEIATELPGDDIVGDAVVVMNRAFTLDAGPDIVWPWLVQLGKRRAGWYLPRTVERFVPRGRRAIRHIDPAWQHLRAGDVVPDYGGRDASFTADTVQAPTTLVYRSRRGETHLSWAIVLTRIPRSGRSDETRVHLRLRLGPVRHVRLASSAGDLLDLMTIAGMAAGLRERLAVDHTNRVAPVD